MNLSVTPPAFRASDHPQTAVDGATSQVPLEAALEVMAEIENNIQARGDVRGTSPAASWAQPSLEARLLDPTFVLAALQHRMRDSVTESKQEQVELSGQRAEGFAEKRAQALDEARKAAEQSSSFLGLSGSLGELAKVAAVAAAVAASATTGGAALGLAIAGAALLLGGDKLAEGAVAMGVVGKNDQQTLATALKLTGSALLVTSGVAASGGASAAAGAKAGSAGATAGQSAASVSPHTLESMARATHCCAMALSSASRGVAGHFDHEHAMSSADADEANLAADDAVSRMGHAAEGLKQYLEHFQRMAQHLAQAREARAQAAAAASRLLA